MRIWPCMFIALLAHGLLLALPALKRNVETTRFEDIHFVLVSSPVNNAPEPAQEILSKPLLEQTFAPAPQPAQKPKPPPTPPKTPVPLPLKPEPAQTPEPDKPSAPVLSAREKPPTTQQMPQVVRQQVRPRQPLQTAFGEPQGPRFKDRVAPEYPRRARRMHREGVVVLELHISAEGRLLEAIILEKAGYGMDEAALQALQCSTFFPAVQSDRPVASRARLNIRYQLTE